MNAITALITSRRARIQHLDLGWGALCGSSADIEVEGRFTELPVCTKCEAAHDEATFTASLTLPADLARAVAKRAQRDLPELARTLRGAYLSGEGENRTALVTLTRTQAEDLRWEITNFASALEKGLPTATKTGITAQKATQAAQAITHELNA